MKLDKKKSIKNKIGVLVCGSFLSLTLTPTNVLAENIDISYVPYNYGEDKVIIIKKEDKDIVITKDEFDKIINSPNDIVYIEGEEFVKEKLNEANISKEKNDIIKSFAATFTSITAFSILTYAFNLGFKTKKECDKKSKKYNKTAK